MVRGHPFQKGKPCRAHRGGDRFEDLETVACRQKSDFCGRAGVHRPGRAKLACHQSTEPRPVVMEHAAPNLLALDVGIQNGGHQRGVVVGRQSCRERQAAILDAACHDACQDLECLVFEDRVVVDCCGAEVKKAGGRGLRLGPWGCRQTATLQSNHFVGDVKMQPAGTRVLESGLRLRLWLRLWLRRRCSCRPGGPDVPHCDRAWRKPLKASITLQQTPGGPREPRVLDQDCFLQLCQRSFDRARGTEDQASRRCDDGACLDTKTTKEHHARAVDRLTRGCQNPMLASVNLALVLGNFLGGSVKLGTSLGQRALHDLGELRSGPGQPFVEGSVFFARHAELCCCQRGDGAAQELAGVGGLGHDTVVL